MTRTAVPAGMPIAEARAHLDVLAAKHVPTGSANAASTTAWSATVVASATPHTKGAWTQLIASTPAELNELMITVRDAFTASAASSTLLDIGIGGAGAETVLLPDMAIGYYGAPRRIPCPRVPIGTRISARSQSVQASRAASVYVIPYKRTPGLYGNVIALGADAATSRGVTLTDPGAINTKGAWTQITAATPQPLAALAVGIQAAGSSTLNDSSALVDIGMGASGAEVTIIGNVPFLWNSSEIVIPLDTLGSWDVAIPAGARLACRYARAGSGVAVDAILYGTAA